MIYLDNAATTRVEPTVNKMIEKYNSELYFNPSALYGKSSDIVTALTTVRDKITHILGAPIGTKVVFTGGATEASNLAIFGSNVQRGKRYLFGDGEHPSVHNCALELIKRGVDVQGIPLQSNGEIDYDQLDKMLDAQVGFVSTMLVSNETGAINDIARISRLIRKKSPNAIFHVDAVQGFCKVPFNFASAGVDMCSLSAHKIYGPKGVGALVIRPNLNIKNIVFGGGQEKGLRSGTENISGIMAFGEVIQKYDSEYIKTLKGRLLSHIIDNLGDKVIVNGNGSPYILSLSIDGIRGETLVHALESHDIIIGTGSACSSSKIENRTLHNIGRTKSEILGSIRISFGKYNTNDEIDIAGKAIVEEINKLLAMNDKRK